jgi:hypothetical protein
LAFLSVTVTSKLHSLFGYVSWVVFFIFLLSGQIQNELGRESLVGFLPRCRRPTLHHALCASSAKSSLDSPLL